MCDKVGFFRVASSSALACADLGLLQFCRSWSALSSRLPIS